MTQARCFLGNNHLQKQPVLNGSQSWPALEIKAGQMQRLARRALTAWIIPAAIRCSHPRAPGTWQV